MKAITRPIHQVSLRASILQITSVRLDEGIRSKESTLKQANGITKVGFTDCNDCKKDWPRLP